MNYKLIIAYDGTPYHGWQVQPHCTSVAQVLQDTYYKVFKEHIAVVGASRTDQGVHALGQVARIRTSLSLDPEQLRVVWNRALPSSIVIRHAAEAPENFHPQFNVVSKTYYYHFFLGQPMPFWAPYGYFHQYPLDLEKLRECLSLFEGTHDFRSFCTDPADKSTVRTITYLRLRYNRHQKAGRIIIKGPGFLHFMIRRIVGACFDVASKKELSVEYLRKALAACNAQQNLAKAPAHGLLLRNIVYTTDITQGGVP